MYLNTYIMYVYYVCNIHDKITIIIKTQYNKIIIKRNSYVYIYMYIIDWIKVIKNFGTIVQENIQNRSKKWLTILIFITNLFLINII